MDDVHLLGAEDVKRAALILRDVAADMNEAARSFAAAVERAREHAQAIAAEKPLRFVGVICQGRPLGQPDGAMAVADDGTVYVLDTGTSIHPARFGHWRKVEWIKGLDSKIPE